MIKFIVTFVFITGLGAAAVGCGNSCDDLSSSNNCSSCSEQAVSACEAAVQAAKDVDNEDACDILKDDSCLVE